MSDLLILQNRNSLDFYVWEVMLKKYEIHTPRSKNKTESKTLQTIQDNLLQEFIDRTI